MLVKDILAIWVLALAIIVFTLCLFTIMIDFIDDIADIIINKSTWRA